MTVEILRYPNPTKRENLVCNIRCYSCPMVSEEDGEIIGPPPETLASFVEQLGIEAGMVLVQKHEDFYGPGHRIVVEEVDLGEIRKKLWD